MIVSRVNELVRKFAASDLTKECMFRVKKEYLVRQVHEVLMSTGVQLKQNNNKLQGL